MKKPVIIMLGLISSLIVLILSVILLSFAVVKPTTDRINRQLAEKLSSIVMIPLVPASAKQFKKTVYFWEMETPQKEIVGVNFTHDTFFENKENMEATLEIEEKGDASIFIKALPGIIADQQTLSSALDPEKANLEGSASASYKRFQLFVKPDTKQTTKITFDLKKERFTKDLEEEYKKLYSFPKPILKFLYNFQKLTLDLLAG